MLSTDIEIVEKYLVSREYNEAVTPAWLRIKAVMEESTNSPHNKKSTPCCRVCGYPLNSQFECVNGSCNYCGR